MSDVVAIVLFFNECPLRTGAKVGIGHEKALLEWVTAEIKYFGLTLIFNADKLLSILPVKKFNRRRLHALLPWYLTTQLTEPI
jgi:hypothetical protein